MMLRRLMCSVACACLGLCASCLEGSLPAEEFVDDVERDPITQCPLEVIEPSKGRKAYVTVANDDLIAVVDLRDPLEATLERCIPTNPNADWEDEPFDLLVLPSGDLIVAVPHAAQFIRGEIWRIPAGSSEPVARTELSGEPDHLSVSPDGRALFVSSLANVNNPLGPYRESGELAVLSLPSLEVQARVPVGLGAAEVATLDERTVVLASPGLDAVVVLDTVTFEERVLPVGPEATRRTPRYLPFSLTVSAAGDVVYVSCLESGEVRALRIATGEVVAVAALPEGASPYGLKVDEGRGVLWVADAGRDVIVSLDLETLRVLDTLPLGPPETRAGAPFQIEAIPSSPWIVVSQSGDPFNPSVAGSLVVFDADEKRVVREVDLGRGPRHISVVE